MSDVLREMRARLAGAKASRIEPCQPTTAPKPPTGPGWIHEIKHDGYRLIVRRDGAGIRVLTRNGHDWSGRYPLIVSAVNGLRCKSCVIDGEAVACNADGLAEFHKLRNRRDDAAVFLFSFDLLELNGRDLRREPIEARKEALAKLLRGAGPGLRYVEHLDFDDASMIFDHACQFGCEGIVSKRKGSRYVSGRSQQWIKIKNPAAPAVMRESEEEWGASTRRSKR